MLTHWEETRTVIKRLAFVNTPKLRDYNYKIERDAGEFGGTSLGRRRETSLPRVPSQELPCKAQ